MCQINNAQIPSIQERIRHEELMIYNRIHWMLTFQGFLFASLAIATKSDVEPNFHDVIFNTIPLLGAAVGLLTFLGIIAAYMHMDEIRSSMKTLEDKKKDFGAAGIARWMGRANSGLLPVIIVLTWIKLYFELT